MIFCGEFWSFALFFEIFEKMFSKCVFQIKFWHFCKIQEIENENIATILKEVEVYMHHINQPFLICFCMEHYGKQNASLPWQPKWFPIF